MLASSFPSSFLLRSFSPFLVLLRPVGWADICNLVLTAPAVSNSGNPPAAENQPGPPHIIKIDIPYPNNALPDCRRITLSDDELPWASPGRLRAPLEASGGYDRLAWTKNTPAGGVFDDCFAGIAVFVAGFKGRRLKPLRCGRGLLRQSYICAPATWFHGIHPKCRPFTPVPVCIAIMGRWAQVLLQGSSITFPSLSRTASPPATHPSAI